MFVTRIVKSCSYYYVDYKWTGSIWTAIKYVLPFTWTRYSMVPDSSLEDARSTAKHALSSYNLNWWKEEVIE